MPENLSQLQPFAPNGLPLGTISAHHGFPAEAAAEQGELCRAATGQRRVQRRNEPKQPPPNPLNEWQCGSRTHLDSEPNDGRVLVDLFARELQAAERLPAL